MIFFIIMVFFIAFLYLYQQDYYILNCNKNKKNEIQIHFKSQT